MLNSLTLPRRAFLFAPMALGLAACSKSEADTLKLSGSTMGTSFNIIAVDPAPGLSQADLQVAVNAALQQVDVQMSNWRADSEISLFNALRPGESMAVSRELMEVARTAENIRHATDGRFDTAIGPLIELWGFGPQGMQKAPHASAVEKVLAQRAEAESLTFGVDQMHKGLMNTQVYLSGIGKGHGVDHVAKALGELGINNYMIEIGGDLVASGMNAQGLPWQIGVETPDAHSRGILQVLGISGLGVATSGDYRSYFEEGGKRYSHLIDPITGHPVTHDTASATVLADNAMLADAWSTAMLILGRERGLDIAAKNNIAVMFAEKDVAGGQKDFTISASPQFTALVG